MIDYGEMGVPEEVGNTEIAVDGCSAIGRQLHAPSHALLRILYPVRCKCCGCRVYARQIMHQQNFIYMYVNAGPCHAMHA